MIVMSPHRQHLVQTSSLDLCWLESSREFASFLSFLPSPIFSFILLKTPPPAPTKNLLFRLDRYLLQAKGTLSNYYQMGRAALAVACCVWCVLRRGPSGPVEKGFCLIFFTIYPSIKLLCNACCLPVPGVRLLSSFTL